MSFEHENDPNYEDIIDTGQSTQRQLRQVQKPEKSTAQSIVRTVSQRQAAFTQTNLRDSELEKAEGFTLSLSNNDYKLANAAHPVACIFTLVFKISSIFIYLFLGYILSHVITFITVVVLGAADFWLTKNISGRLLVGMRWWSDFDQSGEQIWKFETMNKNNSGRTRINKVDKTFFWSTLILNTIFWALLLLLKILTLNIFWGLLVCINFTLSAINLYGYYQCKGEKEKKQIEDYGRQIGVKGIERFSSVI